MTHRIFRPALFLAIALIPYSAFGQGGWSAIGQPGLNTQPSSPVALPAVSPSAPWPRVAQTTLPTGAGNYAPGPVNYAPGPGNYNPGPANYAAGAANYSPRPANYFPRPTNYAPAPTNYAPGAAHYAPGPTNYAPRPANYAPGPSHYAAGPTNYTPGVANYAPRPANYPSGPARFASAAQANSAQSASNYRNISNWSLGNPAQNQNGSATPSGYGGAGGYCDSNQCNLDTCRPCNPWYFSGAGLMMAREHCRRVWTTYETNENANQLMSTCDADTEWEAGFEVHVGRQFCCGAYAVDLGYWTLDDFTGYSSQTHASTVSTPLLFNDLEFGLGGAPVQGYFDSADEHRITRRNTVQNIELNLLEASNPCGSYGSCGSCSPWRSRKSVGLRYFQFNEDLSLYTLDSGWAWGSAGEVGMHSSVDNDLFGVQVGYQLDHQCGNRASWFIAPKFGIYNNRIEHTFDLRRGDGVAAVPTAASGVSGGYPVSASTNVVSFLTELNLGLSWQANCHWSLFGGYRVIAVTGVGLADSQIPQYIIDIPEIADIDYSDALILHGAFFGVSYSL